MPVSPTISAQPQGDPARQAIAALGGYAYQLYASSLAWLQLDVGEQLYLEVAEDYAYLAQQTLTAVQVKAGKSSITINTEAVRDCINSLFDLRARNPHYRIKLHLLSCAEIAPEHKLADRINGQAALLAWRTAAASVDDSADSDDVARIDALRALLLRLEISAPAKEFIGKSDAASLRRDVLQAIVWDCGQPNLTALKQELAQRLIPFCAQHLRLPPADCTPLLALLPHHILLTILHSQARCLSLTDLLQFISQQTHLSIPRSDLHALLAQAKQAQATMQELQVWSQALAEELDVAGHNDERAEVRLSEGLFVKRKQGELMRKRIEQLIHTPPLGTSSPHRGRSLLLAGEAGHGKSTLLWWLYQHYANRSEVFPLFLKAAWLGQHAGAVKIDTTRLLASCAHAHAQQKTPLILIDTVDLLLRKEEDAAIFMQGTLATLQEQGAIVVMSTRPQEANRLTSVQFSAQRETRDEAQVEAQVEAQCEGQSSSSAPISQFLLTTFDDEELAQALASYAQRFYRRLSKQSASICDASEASLHFARIEEAVAQGRPMKEICAIPLALRMLFEIYAPDAIPAEVNIFGLYRDYWAHRIEDDLRSAKTVSLAQAHNWSKEASWLALMMLSLGTLELEADFIKTVFAHCDLSYRAVDELQHRGIVQQGPSGSWSFFHQTFFEHAAARALLSLLAHKGLSLLTDRIRQRSDDLFLKPILQHALLLAETGLPRQQSDAQSCFFQMLTSHDLADQSLAVYVHCHWKKSDAKRSERITQKLFHLDHIEQDAQATHAEATSSQANLVLQIEFLRCAGNMVQARIAELPLLFSPMWHAGAHSVRLRKHMMHLLARLAWRMPLEVIQFLQQEQVLHYVFSKQNEKDDLAVPFLDIPGNVWLLACSSAHHAAAAQSQHSASELLRDALRAALEGTLRFSRAEQIVGIIAKGDLKHIGEFLQLCHPHHHKWPRLGIEGPPQSFTFGYCDLWARHWQAEGKNLQELLAAVPQQNDSSLNLHLLALARWCELSLMDEVSLTKGLDSILTAFEHSAQSHQMQWCSALLGPILRTCTAQQAPLPLQSKALEFLAQRLALGMSSRKTLSLSPPAALGQTSTVPKNTAEAVSNASFLPLGIACRLLVNANLSPAQLVQICGAPLALQAHDWQTLRELAPLLFPATISGLASAQAAYAHFVADMGSAPLLLSALQQQFMLDYASTGQLREAENFLRMIAHSGDSSKLISVAQDLRAKMENGTDQSSSINFTAQVTQVITSLLQNVSSSVRSRAVQALPDLQAAGLLPAFDINAGFALLSTETYPKNRAHIAVWLASHICQNNLDALRLLEQLHAWLSQLLAKEKVADKLFLKEAYLKAFAALMRRGLLATKQTIGRWQMEELEMDWLNFTIQAPFTEKHLSLFGWSIANCGRTAPTRAAALLQALLASSAAQQIGNGSKRDLSNRLLPPTRDIFIYGQRSDWLALLALVWQGQTIDYRLTRAIVEVALTIRGRELAAELEAIRQDTSINDDLRKLVSTYKHHHHRGGGSDAWEGLLEVAGLGAGAGVG